MSLGHREQPKISEESIRPLFVIALALPLTRSVLLPAQRRKVEIGNTQSVLDGDLDAFIAASLKQGV